MKTKLISSARWIVVGLICVAGLLLAGFTQGWGRNSPSQLADEPLLLQVPVLKQYSGTSCGEAVIAMTYNYAYPETPIREAEVIQYATTNGYYTPLKSPYTSPANMVNIAEYYADDVSTGTVYSAGQGLSLLIRKLRAGEPVIIDVLSNFSDPQSEAHFIVVTGLSVDPNRSNAILVHYNDPLTGTQQTAEWAGSTGVWNAWHTNLDPGGPGWWLVISPP